MTDNKYTLKQIIETWEECYGEDMSEEYVGFLDSLNNLHNDHVRIYKIQGVK